MAYTKTLWKAREGVKLNKFTKSEETTTTVILTNTPESVTEPGEPFSVENMNHIETGIAEAHEAITAEVQARETTDGKLAAVTEELGTTNNILSGTRSVPLTGAL